MASAVENAQLGALKLANSAAALRKASGSLENAWKWLSSAHLMVEQAKLPLFVAAGAVNEGQGEGNRIAQLTIQADLVIKEMQLAVRNLQEEVKRVEQGESRLHDELLVWIERIAS